MTKFAEFNPDWYSVPGDTIKDCLEERSMTQSALAKMMGRPKKTINEIIKGKTRITALTAIQLEAALNIPAKFWLNRQTQFDLWIARQPEKIHARRVEKRITLRQFCRDLKVDPSWWSKVERQLMLAKPEQLQKALDYLETK